QECLWPDDEPQHADRDARRIRLHGSGLRRMDAGSRVFDDARRAAGRARFDGHRDQIGARAVIDRLLLAALCLSTLAGAVGLAQSPATSNTRVTPGDLVVDPPTLLN